jgi:hypothetical protein
MIHRLWFVLALAVCNSSSVPGSDAQPARPYARSRPARPTYREELDQTSVIVIGEIADTEVVSQAPPAGPIPPRFPWKPQRDDAGRVIEPPEEGRMAATFFRGSVGPTERLLVLRAKVRVRHAFLAPDPPDAGSLLDVDLGFAMWPRAMDEFRSVPASGPVCRKGAVVLLHLAEVRRGHPPDNGAAAPATRPARRPDFAVYELVILPYVVKEPDVKAQCRRLRLRVARYEWLNAVYRVLDEPGDLDRSSLLDLIREDALCPLELPPAELERLSPLRQVTREATSASAAWQEWRTAADNRFIVHVGD